MLPASLAPLAAYPHFVAWRLEWNTEREKFDKIPYSPIHGGKASSTNPATWGTYEQARAYADAHQMAGVGFVFSERDPFWFLDIDGAWNGTAWSLVAQELCARLPGVAIEVSQSGTGLHLIGSGRPPLDHGNKNIPLKLELYTKERFVALTGTNATGLASVDATDALAAVADHFFKRIAGTMGVDWTTVPDPEWSGPEDDGELLERMLRSGRGQSASAAFEGKANDPTFEDLFTGNVDVLRGRWPPNAPGGDFDHSGADQSLANLLAFWTGRNCERIERIMRTSALARSKWEPHVHPTYLQNTILKAIGLVRNVYKQTAPREHTPVPPPPPVPKEEIEQAGFSPRVGARLRTLAGAQLEHFAGCTYITSLNKVLTPDGARLDQARFDVLYGGHEFVLDLDGKKTTASAWAAFTQNHNFQPPIADSLCFRPEHGSGGIINDAGRTLANIYVPAPIDRLEGDPAPFLDLMRRQLPVERDRTILTHWMASVVQNPGLKAQWWPILQGGEGNGKTYYLLIMSFAVGSHYAHLPNTAKMIKNGMNFNGWIEGKLFLGMEEVYAQNRREFFEEFKTTVTNPRLPIEGKGVEEVTGDNRANGIITTNFKDGVPITGKNRRYAPFFMAQQDAADCARDGLTDEYFLNFKRWMFGTGEYAQFGANYGFRIVANWLATMPLAAEFDPNQLCIRAPETSSTQEAISTSRGRAEQEIQEAIGEERPGFAGGWISSMKLEELLDRKRFGVPRNKRREMLQALGYDYHPALAANDGRTPINVAPDNGKPRLFCRVGSIPALNITSPREAAKAYSEAQLKAGSDKSPAGVVFNDK